MTADFPIVVVPPQLGPDPLAAFRDPVEVTATVCVAPAALVSHPVAVDATYEAAITVAILAMCGAVILHVVHRAMVRVEIHYRWKRLFEPEFVAAVSSSIRKGIRT